LKIIVFPKAFKSLLISCLKLVFSNLSWSLARKSKFCIFIWVLNAIIHIVSSSLPLYSRIFYRVRTLGYNPIKFGCLNVSFVFQSYFINFKSKLIIFIIFFQIKDIIICDICLFLIVNLIIIVVFRDLFQIDFIIFSAISFIFQLALILIID